MSEKEEKKVLNDEELGDVNGGAFGKFIGGAQGSNQAISGNGSFANQVLSGTNANQGVGAINLANQGNRGNKGNRFGAAQAQNGARARVNNEDVQ